jgi:hypothetical protein
MRGRINSSNGFGETYVDIDDNRLEGLQGKLFGAERIEILE